MRMSYAALTNWYEKYIVVATVSAFVGGILSAKYFPALGLAVDRAINGLIDGYGFVAPFVIFIILAPALARIWKSGMGGFGAYVIRWFAVRKVLACLWAIAFMAVVLRLPFLPQNSPSLAAAVTQTLRSLGVMALTSPYFWAMYASIAAGLVAVRVEWLFRALTATVDRIEPAARHSLPFMSVFMFAIGVYLQRLPENIAAQVGLDGGSLNTLQPLNIWGWQVDPTAPSGMILIYLLGALLTAVACQLWQCSLLLVTVLKESRFTIKSYIRYWVRVYPLLWATSSEAIATPLNLYLVKRYAPWVRDDVRRFIISIGSYMNINGTLINVFVLATIVFAILGIPVSIVELLLVIPVVFLISYGVPGIPGELVLFAGPIALLMNMPADVAPVFLTVYIGIQIGLPDSFRTGSNSTDDHISVILMNRVYEESYLNDASAAPATVPVGASAAELTVPARQR